MYEETALMYQETPAHAQILLRGIKKQKVQTVRLDFFII